METRLFRVVQLYVSLGDGKNAYLPGVKEVCIIKETPNTYLCASDIATGWHSRIKKPALYYGFTPVEAWDKYIARATALLASLRKQQNETSDLIAYAKAQRKAA